MQVRASSMVDLVYKQGQAGVTKATVSVTFNNEDTFNVPTGYGDKKKIVVTRQVGGCQQLYLPEPGSPEHLVLVLDSSCSDLTDEPVSTLQVVVGGRDKYMINGVTAAVQCVPGPCKQCSVLRSCTACGHSACHSPNP